MQLRIINTGNFKLDGGAMFGVVPKSLWSRTNPADDNNLCTWTMRCLLIEDGDRLILIDNGIGNKQDARFFSHYYLHGDHSLDKSLKAAGFDRSDVTDMFLTHLHFDHCGGSVDYVGSDQSRLDLHFPNAKYWSHENHWNWAIKPNPREKASFLKENILHFVSDHVKSPFDSMEILTVDGHTEKMMIPKIKYKEHVIVFMADLLPSIGHIPLPYVMGYDTRPLITLKEKEAFLNEAAEQNYVLFFEHDAVNECCTVVQTEKGVRLERTFPLSEIL